MRGIKFRGKSKTNNEWIYGSLINNTFCSADGDILYIIDCNKLNYDCWEDIAEQIDEYEVINESVGQYTEQNDINGNEIYEGMDVRQVSVLVGGRDRDFIGEVKFYDGTWWIDIKTDAVELFSETCENTIVTGEE